MLLMRVKSQFPSRILKLKNKRKSIMSGLNLKSMFQTKSRSSSFWRSTNSSWNSRKRRIKLCLNRLRTHKLKMIYRKSMKKNSSIWKSKQLLKRMPRLNKVNSYQVILCSFKNRQLRSFRSRSLLFHKKVDPRRWHRQNPNFRSLKELNFRKKRSRLHTSIIKRRLMVQISWTNKRCRTWLQSTNPFRINTEIYLKITFISIH